MPMVYFIKSGKQRSLPWILSMQNKFSMSLNKPTGCGSILNSVQIDSEICEKICAEVFEFSHNCNLEWRSSHPNWWWNEEISSLYNHTQLKINRSLNDQVQAYISNFFKKSHKWHSLLWTLIGCDEYAKISPIMVNLRDSWGTQNKKKKDVMKLVWHSSDQQVSKYIKFNPNW